MFNKDYANTAEELRRYSKKAIEELNSILIEKVPDYLVDSEYLVRFMIGTNGSSNNIFNAISAYMAEVCDYDRSFHCGYTNDRNFISGGVISMELYRQWYLENYNKIENNIVRNVIRTAKKEFILNKNLYKPIAIQGMLTSPTIVDIRFKIFIRSKDYGLSIDPDYTRVLKDLSQLLWLSSVKDNRVTEEQFEAGYEEAERPYYHTKKFTSFLRTIVESTVGDISVDNPLLFSNIFVEQAFNRSKELKKKKKESPFNYNYEFLGGLKSIKIYKGNRAVLFFKGKSYANSFIDILLDKKIPELIIPEDLALKNLQKDKFPFLSLNYTKTILKTTSKRRIRI